MKNKKASKKFNVKCYKEEQGGFFVKCFKNFSSIESKFAVHVVNTQLCQNMLKIKRF